MANNFTTTPASQAHVPATAAVNSASTDEEVWAAYDDNANYQLANSTAQANLFIVACRLLLRRLPQMMTQRGATTRTNPELIREEMNDAIRWLSSNDGGGVRSGGVGYFGFNFVRS